MSAQPQLVDDLLSETQFTPPLTDPLPSPSLVHDQPVQLDLFATNRETMFVPDTRALEGAVSQALVRSHLLVVKKAENGFELALTLVDGTQELEASRPGLSCGFSRRAAELLVTTVEREQRPLWARPAGGKWTGWIEWGLVVV